ncbi:MAG: competence protein TfoX, partial [Gammaproteobacteria bacterium]|nr:competence protein TfoX [Gammaproteobacteria bacterium]
MASDASFVEFVVDQIHPSNQAASRMMFGEYAVYSKGKLVALICDNLLYVKPTAGGRSFIGNVVESPPYPGAKPSFLIGDKIEDGEWLSQLVEITHNELPAPK